MLSADTVLTPPEVVRVVGGREGVLPVYVDDFDNVIAHASEPVRTYLELLWETGLRYVGAESLRKCHVGETAKAVRISKRGNFVAKRQPSYRSVPVSDELCENLAALAVEPEGRLFPCEEKYPYQYWRYRFQLAQKGGLAGDLSFHDLRRAVADRLRRAGVRPDAYCTFMGHSAITGLRHYATVDDGDLRKAHAAAMKGVRRRDPSTVVG